MFNEHTVKKGGAAQQSALVSLAGAWFLPETYRRDLSAGPTNL
ncbi:MAG: hypothetical protein ABIW48_07680 [Burkholderiales bacterium]